jgi:E3 ubiquitin-protein ligase synoviolin
MRLLLKAI